MKTQAALFPEPDKYDTIELTIADPGPEDIVVRTLVSAISPGTERWVMRGKHIGSAFPCVPGYHRVGVVEHCGEQVADVEPGDIVYGSANRWEEKDILSMWGAHVGHSVGPATAYHFVASSMLNRFELETVAFTILAGVGSKGIRFADVQATQKVLIIGAGIVGIAAAQTAALRGASAVLLDKDPERIAFLQRHGMNVISVDDPDLESKLKEIAPDGFDVLQDTVGHAPTTDAMVQHTHLRGTLVLQAQYFDKERCAVDLDQIKIRELTVKTSCGIDEHEWHETMTNIRRRRLRIGPLITHRLKAPEELMQGYEMLDTGKPFNLGIVFLWDKNL